MEPQAPTVHQTHGANTVHTHKGTKQHIEKNMTVRLDGNNHALRRVWPAMAPVPFAAAQALGT